MLRKNNLSLSFYSSSVAILLYFALAKLLIHFLANGEYGYFSDELYYLSCSENLSFGYVEHAPLVEIVIKVSRALLGDSLFALRFFSAVAGALTVFLTGLIARELGGKRYAQALAVIALIVSPIHLFCNNTITPNAFEILIWTLAAYIVIRILKTENYKLWVLAGIVMGMGLLNKHSILFFGFGLFIGLILTPNRKYFRTRWLWLCALSSFAIFLPNFIWQVMNDWPTLEFIRGISKHYTLYENPLKFLISLIFETHPLAFPILIFGIFYYLVSRSGKPYRIFGWVFVTLLILVTMNKARTPYYFGPVYPLLFAAGAVQLETVMNRRGKKVLKPAVLVILLAGGVVTAPLMLPVLPAETLIKYSSVFNVHHADMDRTRDGKMPQPFSYMFGWEEMAKETAKIYKLLPLEYRSRCAIYCSTYPIAGAIDFFGPKYGLPKAISGHMSYWLWGPRDYTGEIMICVGGLEENYKRFFKHVKIVNRIKHDYASPEYYGLPVYLCQGISRPLKQVWPGIKYYL